MCLFRWHYNYRNKWRGTFAKLINSVVQTTKSRLTVEEILVLFYGCICGILRSCNWFWGPSSYQSQSTSCAKCTSSSRPYPVEILSWTNKLLHGISSRPFFTASTPQCKCTFIEGFKVNMDRNSTDCIWWWSLVVIAIIQCNRPLWCFEAAIFSVWYILQSWGGVVSVPKNETEKLVAFGSRSMSIILTLKKKNWQWYLVWNISMNTCMVVILQ